MITESMRLQILDILENTEALDKITVTADHTSRSVTIYYEHLDGEWFREVCEELSAAARQESSPPTCGHPLARGYTEHARLMDGTPFCTACGARGLR